MNPIDAAPLISEVAKAGALEAFMLLVIISLAGFSLYLIKDSRAERKEFLDALSPINTTLAGIKELVNVLVNNK